MLAPTGFAGAVIDRPQLKAKNAEKFKDFSAFLISNIIQDSICRVYYLPIYR